MNRAERRRLAKQEAKVQRDPVYNIKASDAEKALINSPFMKEIMEKHVRERILALDKQYSLDMDTTVLWTLRQYGWGPTRLKRFYRDLFANHREMRQRYEMMECFPERQMLKEQGIDVEAWFNELFEEDGTYKVPVGERADV